jgi:hypothetical protein
MVIRGLTKVIAAFRGRRRRFLARRALGNGIPRARRAASRIFGLLLSLGAGLAPSSPSQAGSASELGILHPFYRATQLQGQLIGMGLLDIPDYLTGPDIDLKYAAKPGMAREIPFVDSFTIVRFLGGYREDWLRKFRQLDERLGRRSLDYAIRESDGSLRFRPELIRQRLEPYLAAGYRAQDITIMLQNVPWDLATKDGRPPVMTEWGRSSPPGDLDEWSRLIGQFALDLQAYLGPAASDLEFETCGECDQKANFEGSATEFFQFYAATDRALHSVLPEVSLTPGEFTGNGECTPKFPNCVYDTRDFLDFAAREHLRIADVPRSLHSLLDKPATAWPSAAAERAMRSYARLPPAVAEVHQFGLLDEPFGDYVSRGSDAAALQANWEFQVLLRLWERLKPRRVFHWGGFDTVGKMAFLNGSGFLRLILDRYRGWHGYLLDPQDEGRSDHPSAARSGAGSPEVMALGVTDGARSAVILSSFSPYPGDLAKRITVTVPPEMLAGGTPLKSIRYRQSRNVHALMRHDLAADGNLKPEFGGCPLCVAAPMRMARDAERARAMIARNRERYVEAMKDNLRWRENDPDLSRDGTDLRATLELNELLLIEK